ncbi:MAG: hypothetical protein WAU88_07430 [Candidatus Zixiibacteriota bacterium]
MKREIRSIHRFDLLFALIVCGMIFSCGKGGGTNPTKNPPSITQFTSSKSDMVPGDSTLITYAVTGADSTILTPSRQKLNPAGGGSVYLKPVHPVRYYLVAYNNDGLDSANLLITMNAAVPSIQTAALSQDTIAKKDTSLLTYTAVRADSITVTSVGKLASATSGTAKLSPPQTTSYTMIAFNTVGNDTVKFTLSVEVPAHVQALNGLYYKGAIGSAGLTPALRFSCTNAAAQLLYKPWIHFSTDGDGLLSADSARPDPTGSALLDYQFSDTLGYAVITAATNGSDTARIAVRADIFVPGPHGQGQYVKFDDKYSVLKALNGSPVQVDHPIPGWNIANYEANLGVVFWVSDPNNPGVLDDNEDIGGIIATTVYTGKTTKGIGIGSSYQSVVAAYGAPDSMAFDPTDPPAWYIDYRHLDLYFYGDAVDTSIIQMEGYEGLAAAPRNLRVADEMTTSVEQRMVHYRLRRASARPGR